MNYYEEFIQHTILTIDILSVIIVQEKAFLICFIIPLFLIGIPKYNKHVYFHFNLYLLRKLLSNFEKDRKKIIDIQIYLYT